MTKNNTLQSISENISHAARSGVIHLKTSKTEKSTHSIINNKDVVNFSSYSYLGLERNKSLINGCITATKEYGTQFGFSRTYIAVDLYDILETELTKIFNNKVIVAPTTTLAHQSALPVIIGDNDLIIIDQYAHASIHQSVKMLKDKNVIVQILRHNQMDELEKRIVEFQRKNSRVWYMCDGVYSMHGDFAPVKKIERLMNKHPTFSVYIDDAHGMSWCGEKGKGFVLSKIKLHNQMVIVTSLNKAFAASGGAIIVPTRKMKEEIRNCGNTMIFSTPIQPPMLGAGIASCLLHQTNELSKLQIKLNFNINYCIERIKKIGLIEISQTNSPVFFIPCCFPKVCYSLSKRMLTDGFYLTPTAYPAVSPRKAGVRFCISADHTLNQIDKMLEALSYHYNAVLNEEDVQIELISKSFKLEIKPKGQIKKIKNDLIKIEKFNSIEEIDSKEWNCLFKQGIFDSNNLRMLEKVYSKNNEPEHNWFFHYFIVRDQNDKIVLATYFTECILKEDIFNDSKISLNIEMKRQTNKYFMCNSCLLMGASIIEGQPFYLNLDHINWKKAVLKLFDNVNKLQFDNGINSIFLRDFVSLDNELSDFFIANGYIKTELPDFSHVLSLQSDISIEEFLAALPRSKRRKIVYEARRFEDRFIVETKSQIDISDLKKGYELYLNVQRKSMVINSFPLPFSFFKAINNNSDWEFILLYINDPNYPLELVRKLVGIVLCHKNNRVYTPLYMGLDYKYKHTHNIYKQIIWQMIKRPIEMNMLTVNLGMTASLHKTRYGATPILKEAFVQMQDTFNQEVLVLESIEEGVY